MSVFVQLISVVVAMVSSTGMMSATACLTFLRQLERVWMTSVVMEGCVGLKLECSAGMCVGGVRCVCGWVCVCM